MFTLGEARQEYRHLGLTLVLYANILHRKVFSWLEDSVLILIYNIKRHHFEIISSRICRFSTVLSQNSYLAGSLSPAGSACEVCRWSSPWRAWRPTSTSRSRTWDSGIPMVFMPSGESYRQRLVACSGAFVLRGQFQGLGAYHVHPFPPSPPKPPSPGSPCVPLAPPLPPLMSQYTGSSRSMSSSFTDMRTLPAFPPFAPFVPYPPLVSRWSALSKRQLQ